MALRLRVVSEHSTRLGPRATKLFGVHGGTIGRSADNEWILPDPERYLSGKHARVDFRAGTYVLVDTSSNGTFVNGAQVPLGKYHDYRLQDGDHIRLGEYEMLVSIDKSNDFPPEDSGLVAYDGHSPSSSAKKATADDLGADLDLSILLDSSELTLPDARLRPNDAYGQPNDAYGQPTQPPPPRTPRTPTDDAADDETPWHMLTRPLQARDSRVDRPPAEASRTDASRTDASRTDASRTDSSRTDASRTDFSRHDATRLDASRHDATRADAVRSDAPRAEMPPSISGRSFSGTLYDGDYDSGLAAFCRGAGIDARAINSDARTAALQLAGQVLRESILGLMDLNHGSHELRNRFRIPQPADGPESPLNFSKGVDEALLRLLNNLSVRAGSMEAIRNHFRELKAQNTAIVTAMRAAFEEFLQRVDPKELEERFERAGKRGVFGSSAKSKYWDLYAEMYAGLAQRPDDGFPHLYKEAFVKSFEATMHALLPPRRSGIGVDRGADEDPGAQAVGDR